MRFFAIQMNLFFTIFRKAQIHGVVAKNADCFLPVKFTRPTQAGRVG